MISAGTWKRVLRPLLPDPETWAFRGKLAYRTPIEWVILGLHGEGSGFTPDHVYVSVLCTPLFVPQDFLTLSHSWRVPNGTSPVGLDQLAATARLALSELPTQAEALERIASSQKEAAAYAALLLGRVSDARRRLAEPWFPTDDRPFVAETRQRRSTVLEALDGGGASQAIEILRSWRNATAAALRIL